MTEGKSFATTLELLNNRRAKVGVIGLGYVGLPLVGLFARAGYPIVGFDCDPIKIERLQRGESYIRHISSESLGRLVESKQFEPTGDISRLRELQAVVICVPTPLTEHREPDLSYIVATAGDLRDHLVRGQLVVLESTTYPGTLRGVVQPILEESGLRVGVDFFLAYSPEREDPGRPEHSADRIPKVVGGMDPKSHELAVALYRPVVPEIVQVSGPEAAEACKILENTYRAVNIALVNELKMLFERMGIDIWEVIAAASTKPFGFQPFLPGPGLGGHCIPIDPFYLSWIARRFDFYTRFIELAGEINTLMPEYVVGRLTAALNANGKAVRGARICILGMAYKRDVDDPRESPSFELMKRLLELGAEVTYHDPYIPKLPMMRRYRFSQTSVELTAEFLAALDCVLIGADHSCFDWPMIVGHAPLIVDTRGATRHLKEWRGKIWPA